MSDVWIYISLTIPQKGDGKCRAKSFDNCGNLEATWLAGVRPGKAQTGTSSTKADKQDIRVLDRFECVLLMSHFADVLGCTHWRITLRIREFQHDSEGRLLTLETSGGSAKLHNFLSRHQGACCQKMTNAKYPERNTGAGSELKYCCTCSKYVNLQVTSPVSSIAALTG
jgi:hypothetical protein